MPEHTKIPPAAAETPEIGTRGIAANARETTNFGNGGPPLGAPELPRLLSEADALANAPPRTIEQGTIEPGDIEPDEIEPAAIGSRLLRDGLDYWLSKRRPAGLPARSDLDPTEIPKLLPYIELSEVLDEGADFRFRLVGSHLVDADQINPTGQRLSEFFKNPTYKSYQLALYRWVFARRRPLYSGARVPLPSRSVEVLTERLYLPLASDGYRVDVILNFQVCRGVPDSGLELEVAFDPHKGQCFTAAVRL